MRRVILASGSPRRRELLAQAGAAFTVEAGEVDEAPLKGEGAAAYCQRLAVEKAQAACAREESRGGTGFVVLAADTCVVVGDEILGKPVDAADARRMLGLLGGRTHAVMTGVAVVPSGAGGKTASHVEITQVTFDLMRDEEIAAYVAGGEPMDKAGAYAIQGYAARWIPRIEGDYFNVVGLPIARVVRMLEEAEG